MKKIIIYFLLIGSILNAQEGCFDLYTDLTIVCSDVEFYLYASNQSANATHKWYLDGVLVGQGPNFTGIYTNNTNSDINATYIMEGDDGNGCTDFDTLVMTIKPKPTLNYEVDHIQCYSSSPQYTGGIYLTSSSSIQTLKYKESIMTSFNIANDNDTISGLSSGTYDVYIRDIHYCASDTIQVIIIEPDPIGYLAVTKIDDNCNQNTGRIQFLGLNGGTAPYTFIDATSGVSYTSGEFNNAIVGLDSGYYYVDVVDANGCAHNLLPNGELIVTNYETPPAQPEMESVYSLCKGDTLIVVDTESTNEDMWHYYTFPSNSGVSSAVSTTHKIELDSIQANQDSLFVFAIQNDTSALNFGCRSEPALIDLIQKDCDSNVDGEEYVVTAFSPNSNLIENNTFQIDLSYVNDEMINDVKVKIYNRWGDVVNMFDNYNNTSNVWHGDNQGGDALPEGTYFYTIEVPSQSFSTSGWVYLDK